jgi:glycosyltransferase involved in cell wall biosynthesis
MTELVAESGGGIVYDTQEELLAAMDRLCFDPSLRETLGGKGYAACRGRWSAESYISRYLNLIAGIAEERGIVLG